MLLSENSRKPLEAVAYKQNGPYGCAPACLANVGRLLLGENLNPDIIDIETGRDTADDLLGYDRTLWLLRRGLVVHSFIDPDSMIVEGYLDGTDSFDQMIENFARQYYDGDNAAAFEDYGNEDFMGFVKRLQDRKPSYDLELGDYVQSGQYTEDLRPATIKDLTVALRSGKVALTIYSFGESTDHQQLLFPSEKGSMQYDPDEVNPVISRANVLELLSGQMSTEEVYIVSR